MIYLARILDKEYACLPSGPFTVSETLMRLVKASTSLPTAMSVWNTMIIAGLYMEPKFVSYFMPHLIGDIYGQRNIRQIATPLRTKLIPSMKVFESAGGVKGSLRPDLYEPRV